MLGRLACMQLERVVSGSLAQSVLQACGQQLSSMTSAASWPQQQLSNSQRDTESMGQLWGQCQQRGYAAQPAASSPQATSDQAAGLTLHDSAVARLKELQKEKQDKFVALRLEVEGGGCSGFQYKFSIADSTKDDDVVFEKDGMKLLCDSVSLDLVKGSTVEFEDSLMRSAFTVSSNPQSESSCGCGTSFTAKVKL